MFNKLQKTVRLNGLVALGAALGLLAVGAGSALAVPQLMTGYGDQMAWSSPEINAMGNTGTAVYRGGLSNIFNPAFLVAEKGKRLDASISLDQEHEDRFQPLFDSFDSWVVDTAIASNRNHYWQTGFAYAFNAGSEDQPVGIGVSLADRYGFGYNFDEELRNPSPFPPGQGEPARDMLIEERARKVTGTIRTLSVGVGSEINEGISFGAALHYAFGDLKDVRSVRDYVDTDGDDSYRSELGFEVSGVSHSLGIRAVVTERVEIGVAWESALEVKGENRFSLSDPTGQIETGGRHQSIRYPDMFRIGLTFRPQTNPRTVFTIEAEYKPWSELENSGVSGEGNNPQNLNDVTDVRVGLEHLFYNDMPLRFGFRHFDSYADRDAGTSVFSAGVGAPVGNGMLTASLELSKLASMLPHQFPYPDDFFGDNFRADPYARVEDTRFRVGVGYKMEF
jgi:hypothetical protein